MDPAKPAKGYWIVHISVADAENYPRYLAAAKIAFEKYGAKFLVRGGTFELMEGASRDRHVVLAFETYEKALACYRSPEYKEAAALRQAFAVSDLVVVEGFE
ncbi:MAG: DUF1330 domain-containing protein [Hyphomicrobiaceae bacterium]